MLLLQVLKALGDETLKSGAGATQVNGDNKESFDILESELMEIFSTEENVSCLEFAVEQDV